MKRIFFAFLMLATIASCKNDTSTPKGTVNAFIEASKNGDFNAIKKLVSKSDLSLLEMAENMSKMFDPEGKTKGKMGEEFKNKFKDVTYSVLDEKIDGNNATVNVDVKTNGVSKTTPFKLVKEDGGWKISLLSTGLNGGGMHDTGSDMDMNNTEDSLTGSDSFKKGMEQFKNMNVDSLSDKVKESLEKLEKNKDKIQDAAKQWEEAAKKLNNAN